MGKKGTVARAVAVVVAAAAEVAPGTMEGGRISNLSIRGFAVEVDVGAAAEEEAPRYPTLASVCCSPPWRVRAYPFMYPFMYPCVLTYASTRVYVEHAHVYTSCVHPSDGTSVYRNIIVCCSDF